ncbi:HD-GYP domain-containing protein [Andreprevotia chitinilytica]|uniref:HD-GYP domain-containing protein n=1 Tax=Andreprevotia chitinilytica TaxID=396808 RepID=UPI00055235A5|nr:HD domain-containing phosphohydrolase [Andreprevotia chitinilytica]
MSSEALQSNLSDLVEFRDALTDYAPNIERLVSELRRTPDNLTLVADLFRAFHNIKGDASLCRVRFVVPFAHGIENQLSRLRAGDITFSAILAEVILLTLDRLELAVEALAEQRPTDHLQLDRLEQGLQTLGELRGIDLEMACRRLLESLTGFQMHGEAPELGGTPTAQALAELRDGDLPFFKTLALQLEQRSPQFLGRTARNLKLALETNERAGLPADPLQLEAAVYLHDIGMMLLPESLWLKVGRLSDDERRLLADHPAWAAGLLERMPAWREAATIVLQHHEQPDGRGYPHGLKGHEIVTGAKILALVDAFESVMLKHQQRGQQRSVLRAIAEVNASDRQFDPALIAPFNAVIRSMLEHAAR